MEFSFSIIVPVYNRPDELEELLESITQQKVTTNFEVLIIEDGSEETCEHIVSNYTSLLNVGYFFKENSGAGASRNFGMQKANGTYFIILDSDVILPEHYLQTVYDVLQNNFTDAFGGPDAAHPNFTVVQKAINYSMTSFLTTGGIRGKKKGIGKYQLRSYNLGLSRKAFEKTQGFSDMKTGEDIDLTFRLWQLGFQSQLIPDAYVYHKRRTSIKQFFKQTFAFGQARPKLNRMYPGSARLTFWFPSLFLIGFVISLVLLLFGEVTFFSFYYLYFIAVFLDASFQNGIRVGLVAIISTFTQFLGYGLGFLKVYFKI